MEQGGIAFEVVQGYHRRLRQTVLGKGPRWRMVNLWCAVEMGPTQQKKPLTIRHPSPGEIRPELPPARRRRQGIMPIDMRTETKILGGQRQ